MSLKVRGQEVTLLLAVDGVDQEGSMTKVTDFSVTPRTDLVEDDYLGEDETDIDIQHHGYDLSFSVDMTDDSTFVLWDDIVSREKAHTAHPRITLKAIYTFREPGVRPRMTVYPQLYLKMDEEGVGGRKEKGKVKFSGKNKKRILMAL